MTRDEVWQRAMELGAAAGCHQRADRSFFLGDYQFPVCARCTGVFLGQLTAVILLISGKRLSAKAAAGLLTVMCADWLVQKLDVLESTNIRRLITGIMGGAGITFLYFKAATYIIKVLKGAFARGR